MHNIIMTAAWQIAGPILFFALCVCIGLNNFEVVEVEDDEQTPETQHNSMIYWVTEKAS
jgi:hypothetical protein